VQRFVIAVSVVLAAAGLAIGVVALSHKRSPRTVPEVGRASISQLRGLMTEGDVRALFGAPQTMFRDNAEAQCWAYSAAYEVRMCFGPKRRLAWWATNLPQLAGQ
jgi:hypothetical protein